MGQDYQKSPENDKIKRYEHVLTSFMSLMDVISVLSQQKNHPLSNIANFIALLKQQFNWWWIGFYFVSASYHPDILALGPFQGPLACTQIKKGRGVCGSSWQREQSIIVPDVEKFEGHIACSSLSKSQIVIPLFYDNKVIGVLDLDSQNYSEFDQIDDKFLKIMLDHLGQIEAWKWIAEKF